VVILQEDLKYPPAFSFSSHLLASVGISCVDYCEQCTSEAALEPVVTYDFGVSDFGNFEM